uniref:Chaperonin GroEL n=1 Tax=candidate division CPR3 bacterium TaxID=2268181 RepID=A0A7C5YV17_UNCC3
MAKGVIFDDAAKKKVLKGVNIIANTVKKTLGPKGRHIALARSFGGVHVTKDGVTVVKELAELKDPVVNTGAQLVKEAATQTSDKVGDGTTTATLLVQAIFNAGMKYIAAGANPSLIKRGIEKAAKAVIQKLNKMSKRISTKDIEELKRVATISANNDKELGELIAEVINKVGGEGVVTVEEYEGTELTSEYVEGMQIDRGFISPYFITDPERMEAVVEDPYIFITDKKLSGIKEFLPVIDKIIQTGKKNIVVVADDVEGEALATFVVNKLKGVLNILAVKAPGFGDRKKELLEDLAILTGGTVITEEMGKKLEETTLEDLGTARRVVATKDTTTFIKGGGDKSKISSRIEQIKKQIEQATSEYDKEKLQERLAKLQGGVAVIKVGGHTEAEIKELKDRVDDAIHATKAAVEEGIVAGGGVALLDARNVLKDMKGETDDENIGIKILYEALAEPIRQICLNAGRRDAEKIVAECGNGKGYDALHDEEGVDMIEAGIIDPKKVVRIEVETAVSASCQLLLTDAVIYDIPEKKEEETPALSEEALE